MTCTLGEKCLCPNHFNDVPSRERRADRIDVASRLLAAYCARMGLVAANPGDERRWCKLALQLADNLIEEADRK